MRRFENDNPFAPWNDPCEDRYFKPWNNPIYQDDPFAPWNRPLGDERDYERYCDEKGIPKHDR